MTKDEFLRIKEIAPSHTNDTSCFLKGWVQTLLDEVAAAHPEWDDPDVSVTLKRSEWKALYDVWYRNGDATKSNVTREVREAARA